MRKILTLLAAAALLLTSCVSINIDHKQKWDVTFTFAEENYFGDHYDNGCDNYILTLYFGTKTDGIELKLDLNSPQLLGGHEVAGGSYYSVRPGLPNLEYTFVPGSISGNAVATGSHAIEYKRKDSSTWLVTNGSVTIRNFGDEIVVDAKLELEGESFHGHFRGIPTINVATDK